MAARPAATVAGAPERPALLFVDTEAATQSLAPALRSAFALTSHSDVTAAREALQRMRPALVTVDADMMGAAAADFCRAAKALTCRPTVLVTTEAVEHVPGLLAAGCDEVLLKPYAPHLLYTRIGGCSVHLERPHAPQRARIARRMPPGASSSRVTGAPGMPVSHATRYGWRKRSSTSPE